MDYTQRATFVHGQVFAVLVMLGHPSDQRALRRRFRIIRFAKRDAAPFDGATVAAFVFPHDRTVALLRFHFVNHALPPNCQILDPPGSVSAPDGRYGLNVTDRFALVVGLSSASPGWASIGFGADPLGLRSPGMGL